jgi:hypothetical protein
VQSESQINTLHAVEMGYLQRVQESQNWEEFPVRKEIRRIMEAEQRVLDRI